MLEAAHISLAYGAHRALEDVSLRVAAGEIVVILGANGAGKSTLLKVIAGMAHPAPGAAIAVNDNALTDLAPNRIVECGVALVPEGRGVFADLTVGENLDLGAYGRQAREGRQERLAEVLRLFPRLAERRGQVVRTMSGGEQQMVAIGRALMSNPKILMLDEPSLGLSPLLSGEVFRTLETIRETGVGILLVEQNARLSLSIADRAYLLENGRIVGEGRAAVLANDPAVQAAYLGGADGGRHKRFGEGEVVVTERIPSSMPMTPEVLAERAARIQREHISVLRNGVSHANGHAAPVPLDSDASSIVVRGQAAELSKSSTDLAHRASQILAAHVASQREQHASLATLADASRKDKKGKGKKKSSRKAKR